MAVDTPIPRARYASDASRSRGRLYLEPESPPRSPFRRDADRVIHSTAFRRLKHKTQVFVFDEGDHYRTRLTHTVEVVQIARSLARALGLDEDLAEALALAHDLGHTPFGHAGERELDALMAPWGGFDHNAQSLRIVTRLERRYPTFDGLNLTWETLEGLVKHNGPLLPGTTVPLAVAEYQSLQDLELASFPSAEAQVVTIADDIAYDTHDIDDGLRAGLFDADDLTQVPLLGDIFAEIDHDYPDLERSRRAHELERRLITRLVRDVVAESDLRLAAVAPQSVEAVRWAGRPVIGFSKAMMQRELDIKAFLFPRMYRHPKVMQAMGAARGAVRELFGHLAANPGDMPEEWRRGLEGAEEGRLKRRVADYIAGMTDRFLLAEHARFFDSTPDLR
ncbi:deoxyguanosinetriphosphate triphosphohydrolase [Blastochloris viridis]|uniref:Deoxyguanosinetriphosphate triphosphohydrolase-like protein n=1 Tax=Blastochloris viridis TaxID=1079 RepID=A0A0H5BI22_BLAVI|nr:deoxyguanosinetriphosphate triphosphohydrolase [Blastochloris viridis]ALK09327.1 Deoxyguanosinetriphosphate triphosphohydrolase [Blastochloris viridis]BAS00795.1 deoxyguanosinetriphosphate triphosphohydrolase [Blastochloris viridis]CUU41990.1 Deoxyguanosinetriphosphate triphosphohydrolase [Blastochloris viridis]